MDSKKISLLTLCDLSKASDSVNHSILLETLENTATDKFWFYDYLKGRSQSGRLNNTVSSKTTVRYGVPQGSGPILFNSYVNEMSSHFTNCLLVQHADDTQFLHTGEVEELNTLVLEAGTTLSRTRQFFLTHDLKLNGKKTQCIFLGTRHLVPKIPANSAITLHNTTIKPNTHVKTLEYTSTPT